jgi:hypothetical protein
MRGFVGFMRKQFYWVAVGIALIAAPFAIFYPPAVIVIVVAVLAALVMFLYQYYREHISDQPDALKSLPRMHFLVVDDVQGPLSAPIDIDEIARSAREGGPEVSAHILEGSGMALIERYVPVGEIVFPIAFAANPITGDFQTGSIRVGNPLCLWHREAVAFGVAPPGIGVRHTYKCLKCPGSPKPAKNSLEEFKRTVKLLAFSMLKKQKMPLRNESLIDAIKRGRGETPG